MSKFSFGLLAVIGFACLATSPASAQGLGLAGLHDQRREGSRWCMTDHFHSNTGTGATKQVAEREAISAWQGFTSWEYGNHWGLWRHAGSKTLKCEKDGFGQWTCAADARPCQPLARSAGATRRTRKKSR